MEVEYRISNWSDSAEPSMSGQEEEEVVPFVVSSESAPKEEAKFAKDMPPLKAKEGSGKEGLWNLTTLQMVLFWAVFQVLVLVWTLILGYRTFILEAHTTKENHFHVAVPNFLTKLSTLPDTLSMF